MTLRAKARSIYPPPTSPSSLPTAKQVIGAWALRILACRWTRGGRRREQIPRWRIRSRGAAPAARGRRPATGSRRTISIATSMPMAPPQYEESLDARSGAATCKFYGSSVPDIHETSSKFPPDTYAGATQLMLLVGRLREAAPTITFHSSTASPSRRSSRLRRRRSAGPATWPMYPGNLVKMEMKPDFGWLNVVLAPFIPKVLCVVRSRQYLQLRGRAVRSLLQGTPRPDGAHARSPIRSRRARPRELAPSDSKSAV